MSAFESLSINQLRQLREEFANDPDSVAQIDQQIARAEQSSISLPELAAAGAQGATMGWGDEALALAQSGYGLWGNYEESRDRNRAWLDTAREKSPGAFNTAEFAGGFLTPGGFGVQAIKGAKNLGQLAYNTGKVGLGYGAAGGLGYSDADTIGGAVWDTTKGALSGAALNTVIGTAAPAYRAVKNRSLDPQQLLAQVAEKAGITVEKLTARMEELGPNATLADAFPQLRETAYGAYGYGGFVDEMEALGTRNQEAGKRLLTDLEKETGRQPGDVRNEQEFLTTQRTARANEEYQVLEGQGVPYEDAERVLKARSNSAQVKEALDEWRDETGYGIDDFEEGGFVPAQLLQKIRSLTAQKENDLLSRPEPQTARAGQLGRRVAVIDEQLRSIPGWDDARLNFKTASEEIDSIGRGRTTGRTAAKIDTDQGVLEAARQDTPRNQSAYQMGAQQQIIDNILAAGGANDTGSVLSRLGNPRQQEIKFEGAGIPGFNKSADRERAFNETYQKLGEGQGSKTNEGRVATDALGNEMSFGAGALAVAQQDLGVAALTAAGKALKKSLGLRNERTAKSLLQLLLKQNIKPDEIMRLLDTETGKRQLLEFISQGAGRRGRTGPAAVGVLADQLTSE